MGKKLDGQLTLAIATLQMDMREVRRRLDAVEGDLFVILLGAAASTGIMLGYIVSYWVQK